eukprot:3882135-Amphidinium_carterae.1
MPARRASSPRAKKERCSNRAERLSQFVQCRACSDQWAKPASTPVWSKRLPSIEKRTLEKSTSLTFSSEPPKQMFRYMHYESTNSSKTKSPKGPRTNGTAARPVLTWPTCHNQQDTCSIYLSLGM